MAFSIRRILVPIDGSEGAQQAAAHAGDLARLARAGVALLRVHSPEIYQLSVLSEIPPLTDFEYLEVMEKQMNEPAKDPAFASAVEALGHAPKLVNGDAENFKLTWPGDFDLARRLMETR